MAHLGGEYNVNLFRVDASSGSPVLHKAQVQVYPTKVLSLPSSKAREGCYWAPGSISAATMVPGSYLHTRNREPTSGLEPLTCSLRVSGRRLLGVAESCNSRIDKGFVFPVLPIITRCCVRVRGKLGSIGNRSSWITRRRFPRRPDVADARRSAEPTRRNLDERPPHPSALPRPIQRSGYPCRASICSVDHHARDRCGAVFRSYRTGAMHNPASELLRTPLLRTPVNK